MILKRHNTFFFFLCLALCRVADASIGAELIEDRFPRIKLEWELKKIFHAQDVSIAKVWRRIEAYNPLVLWSDTNYRSFGFVMNQKGRDVQVRCDWDDSLSKKELRISGCLVLRGGGPWDLPAGLSYGSATVVPYEKLGLKPSKLVSR